VTRVALCVEMVIPPSCHHKQTNRSFAGKAIEMSIDHKPEDEPETERVLKAGGKVTGDGRINGGLNLSRAIGDHAYKQNKELSDREQMITALPDVKTLTINPGEDEFMVLACDGIWNSMSSQEVVDFIKPRMTQGVEKLSKICEQIFDHCLSPESWFDGIGCDNMTAIIVKFKSSVSKRAASPQPEENEPKRAKTEVNSEVQVDTTV
jgi:protein phosphatase 1G